jgi:hypothetical protein
MALIVVLVLLTIAVAATMTFGEAAAPFRSRFRFLRGRGHARSAVASLPAGLTPTPSRLSPRTSFGAPDTESILVTLLLAGTLSQRDYQRQMAQLAAEESARGARP